MLSGGVAVLGEFARFALPSRKGLLNFEIEPVTPRRLRTPSSEPVRARLLCRAAIARQDPEPVRPAGLHRGR